MEREAASVLSNFLVPKVAAPATAETRTEPAKVEPVTTIAEKEGENVVTVDDSGEVKTTPEKKEEVIAETDKPETAEVIDPYEKVAGDLIGETAKVAEWTPEAKELFKAQFGVDDPVAYKADLDKRLTEAELLKSEYDQIAPVVQAMNKLNPALQKAFALALEGKPTDAQEYLRSLPEAVVQGKAAKDVPKEKLVDMYFPGKLSDEDREALTDPDTDPDVKAAIKARVDHWAKAAGEIHDSKLEEIKNEQAAQKEAQKAQFEAYKQATATAISEARNSKLGALLDPAATEALQTGAFMKAFVEDDGVTPTKDAGTRYLWAVHGEKLMKAAETRGYKRGKMEGSLESTSRMPEVGAGKRAAGDTPKGPQTEDEQARNVLLGILKS